MLGDAMFHVAQPSTVVEGNYGERTQRLPPEMNHVDDISH